MSSIIKLLNGKLIWEEEHECRYFEQYEMDGDKSLMICAECRKKYNGNNKTLQEDLTRKAEEV